MRFLRADCQIADFTSCAGKALAASRTTDVAREPMNPAHNSALAQRYLVDDLPGAHQPGARLHGILQRIDVGAQLTPIAREFLASTGLLALDALEIGRAHV